MVQVLVYDPDPVWREECCRQIGADGSIETLQAESFAAASMALNTHSPDAVVAEPTDEEVVGLVGIVRKLRGQIPVLLFMHPGRETIVIEGLNAGADRYIEKSVPSEASLAALDQVVRHMVSVSRDVMTQERRAEHLEFLSRTAMDFVRMEDGDDIYAYIAEGVRKLVPGALVATSSFNPSTHRLTVRGVAGSETERRVLDEALGSSFIGVQFLTDSLPWVETILSCSNLMEAPSSFHDLSFWNVPEEVCTRIDEQLSVGRAYSMGLQCRSGIYGNVVFRLRKGMELENRELLEAFIGQASVALLRRHARERQLESEARYRAVVESQRELICRFKPDGTHIFVNEAYCRFFGLDAREAIGTRFLPPIPDEERRLLRDYFAAFSPDRSEGTIEHRVLHPDGRARWLQWSDRAFFDDAGGIREFQSVGRDVTERREAQEALALLTEELERRVEERTAELRSANQDLELFSHQVSHDLRAPLRAIDGYLGILMARFGPELPPDSVVYIGRASEGVHRADRFIEGLLSLVRLSRQPFHPVTVDPSELIQSVLDELLPADAHLDRIQISVSPMPPCRADPEMLRHIFLNLISNAIKFTRICTPARIELFAEPSGEGVVYTVRDNGVGFSPADADRLFDDFVRSHDAREYDGSGIGLALVRRIVERHGGRCWAEGAIDQGAVFHFTLGPVAERPLPDAGSGRIDRG